VAQDVRGDCLGYSGLAGGLAHGSLDVDLMQVMTAGASGARVDREPGCGEHVLPAIHPPRQPAIPDEGRSQKNMHLDMDAL
jgi:hypothetical protein